MEEEMKNHPIKQEEKTSGYFVGVRFRGSDKSYYFSTDFDDLKIGDFVIVDTMRGEEIGIVSTLPKSLSIYHSSLELKPIIRKPNTFDMERYNDNLDQERHALETCASYVKSLGLAMDLIEAVYSLDGSNVTITYTSPEKRVDFRDLVRLINPALGTHVELRQIASRDKAKMIGGIGICGLPLCCSTFLNNFEGISIQRAKNQMLTLNIPKLSGPCGKLICCLLYEDDAYTEAKKEFPRPGTIIRTPEGEYTVDSFNVLSKNVRLVNAGRDDWKTYPLEDIRAMQNGTYKKVDEDAKASEDELPSFNLEFKNGNFEVEKPNNQYPYNNRNDHNRRGDQNRNNNQNRQQNNANQNQNRRNQNQNSQHHNNHHRYHHHGHNGPKPNGGNGNT